MRHTLLIIILLSVCNFSLSARFSASGGIGQPIEENNPGLGLEAVYLFNTLSGATLEYTSASGNSSITFFKFDLSGNQTPIPSSDITSPSSGVYIIQNLQDGYGYFASDENKAVWVIDYSNHEITLNSIQPETPENEEERCDNAIVALLIDKNEPELRYGSPFGTGNGSLTRKYTIEWESLEWDENSMQFSNLSKTTKEVAIHNLITVDAPLKNTRFTISGDQYARTFGITKTLTSEEYEAVVPEAHVKVTEIVDGFESDTLSTEGSAPISRRFYVYANEPVADHYDWYIYRNGDRDNPIARFQNETDISYTFTEAGKYIVEVEVSSVGNSCIKVVSVEEFEISESMLEVPNFFSPGTSPGYNDEFKVKYKSLVKFKATIFNRWGNKLFEWSDPEQGWDGKYKGKYVSPGVYFYVIDATGSEGKRYKKGGDINIVRGK